MSALLCALRGGRLNRIGEKKKNFFRGVEPCTALGSLKPFFGVRWRERYSEFVQRSCSLPFKHESEVGRQSPRHISVVVRFEVYQLPPPAHRLPPGTARRWPSGGNERVSIIHCAPS